MVSCLMGAWVLEISSLCLDELFRTVQPPAFVKNIPYFTLLFLFAVSFDVVYL